MAYRVGFLGTLGVITAILFAWHIAGVASWFRQPYKPNAPRKNTIALTNYAFEQQLASGEDFRTFAGEESGIDLHGQDILCKSRVSPQDNFPP